jgi:hypothetical protein
MRGVIVTLVALTTIIAFRAGARWRRNTGTWGDWRLARTKEQGLRKQRWLTLRLAISGMFLLVVYLIASGAVGFAITTPDDKKSPTPSCSSAGTTSCPPSPAPAKKK